MHMVITTQRLSTDVIMGLMEANIPGHIALRGAVVSMLQCRLKLDYSRATRLVDQIEKKGIVGFL